MTAAISQGDLLHHVTTREIRKAHKYVVAAILVNAAQIVFLVVGFYIMAQLMRFGSSGIRGDLVVFLITGVFYFQVHVKAMGAVLRADLKESGAMMHRPMSVPIAVTASVLGSLYLQTASAAVVLLLYHGLLEALSFHQITPLIGTYLLSWGSGVAVGLIFLALRPLAPAPVSLMSQLYSRANMIASGQMFVANALPAHVLVWFSWNPLFHIIDQARGFAFLNYTPWNSSLSYPVAATIIAVVLGMIVEHGMRARLKL